MLKGTATSTLTSLVYHTVMHKLNIVGYSIVSVPWNITLMS